MRAKKIAALALCSALLLSTGVKVNAKDYYKKDFGFSEESDSLYDEIKQQNDYMYLDNCGVDKTKRISSKKDFNQD